MYLRILIILLILSIIILIIIQPSVFKRIKNWGNAVISDKRL
jgi:competence protein ComGC